MSKVEQVRIILERTFGFPVLESDAQIVLDRLTELDRKEAVEHNAHLTGGGLCAECGSPAWTHSVRDHAFVEPHHPQVA